MIEVPSLPIGRGLRHRLGLALFASLLCLSSLGASFQTPNFQVEAPTAQIAQQVGQAAEHFRKEKAMLWLGHEMPTWGARCPIRVTVTMTGAGGATSFEFREGGCIQSQNMHIEGPYDKLLHSVLPHEVTHTVFAYYFRCPVPRWADEGGAVLSENDTERNEHDMMCRKILNRGQQIPMRRLFALTDYPSNGQGVMALYAEGYSVTNFLVSASDRKTFLNFIGYAMHTHNWDTALQKYYHYRSVDELEQAWLTHLRNTRPQQSSGMVAQNQPRPEPAVPGARPSEGDSTNRVVVRLSVPPVQPNLSGTPVFRGASPDRQDDPARRSSPVLTGNVRNPREPAGTSQELQGWAPVILGDPMPVANPAVAAPYSGNR